MFEHYYNLYQTYREKSRCEKSQKPSKVDNSTGGNLRKLKTYYKNLRLMIGNFCRPDIMRGKCFKPRNFLSVYFNFILKISRVWIHKITTKEPSFYINKDKSPMACLDAHIFDWSIFLKPLAMLVRFFSCNVDGG